MKLVVIFFHLLKTLAAGFMPLLSSHRYSYNSQICQYTNRQLTITWPLNSFTSSRNPSFIPLQPPAPIVTHLELIPLVKTLLSCHDSTDPILPSQITVSECPSWQFFKFINPNLFFFLFYNCGPLPLILTSSITSMQSIVTNPVQISRFFFLFSFYNLKESNFLSQNFWPE